MTKPGTPAAEKPGRGQWERPARRFTALHQLPAGQVPDVSKALISMFGPALLLAMDRLRSDAPKPKRAGKR